MLDKGRVEWSEVRAPGTVMSELFIMIAEKEEGRWRFFERSSWEVQWYEIPTSQNLLAQVLQRLAA